jgi:hypothetical protein
MVMGAADDQGLEPVLPSNTTHKRPQRVLVFGRDQFAAFLGGENVMHKIRGVDMSHDATPEMKVQASLRDATDSWQPTRR